MGCGKFNGFICSDCSQKLKRLLPPLCIKCGRSISGGLYCPDCWRSKNQIDSIRSVFVFDGIIRKAIHELKYYHLRSIAILLGDYMADYFKTNNLYCDYLVPIPLHNNRLKYRGYNHSELLARRISEQVNIPILNDCLIRIKDNKPQARTTSIGERILNVDNIFRSKSELVRDKVITLVDDVCTSGATLESCAKSLKLAGAKQVFGFTLAREELERSQYGDADTV